MSTPALNANNTSSHSNSNSNNNNNDGFSELGKVMEDQYVWGFICVVMILSNLFLIFLIYWYRKCRTNPNIIIASMSFNAILLAAFYIFPRFVLSPSSVDVIFCQICVTLGLAFIINSNLHLFLISLDQYIYISHPFLYNRTVNKTRVVLYLVVIWILSILFSFLPYFIWRPINRDYCITVDPNKMQYESIYYLVYFIVLYFVPCGGMILFYGRIYCLAHHHAKLLTTYDQCKQWIQNVRAAKTLSILVGIYIACWTPFVTIFLVVRYKVPPNWTLEEIMKVIKILRYIAFSNPAINAFLYGYFNQVLRQHTVQTIKNQLCCETKYSSNNQYPNSGSFPTIPKTLNNNKIRNCKLGYNVDTKLFQKDHTYPEQFYFKSTRF